MVLYNRIILRWFIGNFTCFCIKHEKLPFLFGGKVKKILFFTEIAYIVGLLLLAAGTALMTYGGLGMSMVVAPAYLLHLYLSKFLPFFSFGVAEYVLQAIILLAMMLVLRKVKLAYFLAFAVAVYYGFTLDGMIYLTALLPDSAVIKIIAYVLGACVSCGALAMLFCSYLPPAAYELFVKEIAQRFHQPIFKVKTAYDFISLAIAVILSLIFFGSIKGVGIGTAVCALVFGSIIRLFQKLYEKIFRFEDRFPWRTYFEEREKTK